MSPIRNRALRRLAGQSLAVIALLAPLARPARAQVPAIQLVGDSTGWRLRVDGRDVLLRGVNWDYFPVGENYAYSLWSQRDDVIKAALDREMPLLRNMGVNAIRQYVGVPPRWIRYIYEQYGIYTVLNHAMGRYGVTVDGAYQPNTDYSDPRVRAVLRSEIAALASQYRDTPGLLIWLIGNENNYGLTWRSAETENLPVGERDAARARYLYSLYGEVARAIKAVDPAHPVAIANGDLQYIDLVAAEAKGIDIFGTNMYRGISFGDAFRVVREKLGLPMMFTEFGADAFNAREVREDQVTQARYLLGQWREIYEETGGKGLEGNAIGGFTFQWTDGWWKYGQETRLDIHDDNASWANAGYAEDYVPGQNNMNEEWWGITAKGRPDADGLFQLYPRAAYYALQAAYALDPYAAGTDLATIRRHFAAIDPAAMALRARGDRAALDGELNDRFRVSEVRLQFETFSSGGVRVNKPDTLANSGSSLPRRGFDHLESFYAEFEAHPTERVTGAVAVNVLGNVPTNRINEIFYENRGRDRTVQTDAGPFVQKGIERVKVYRARVSWEESLFRLEGFYRTGHYHWGYEGDFFGLYREANYGPNLDIYNGEAPLGFELTGKRQLDGFKFAFGPELWWGANPGFLAKYRRQFGGITATAVFQNDFSRQGNTGTSFAVPFPRTRRATLHLATTQGPLGIELGGIWGGDTRNGLAFQLVDRGATTRVLEDRIKGSDAWGAKAKVTYSKGRFNWYAQGAAMGIVADGGPTSTLTYTGWWLKDSGSGNQWNALTGFTYLIGNLQIAPNFLWQKPIVGPIPADVPAPGRPRNILDDPFVVRANRQTTGAELLLTWDPTPGTWMYAWDNDVREDAKFAASVGFTWRHLPTTQDAAIGILADGRTFFPFPGATPPRDLWEVHGRFVSRLQPDLRIVANLYAGTAEPNGSDARLIRRYGGDVRAVKGPVKLMTAVKVNDWGPYDYHRDFNLTFPLQLSGDLAYTLGRSRWFTAPITQLGVSATWRSLDRFSPRYCPVRLPDANGTLTCDPTAPALYGSEWEIRTYLHVGL